MLDIADPAVARKPKRPVFRCAGSFLRSARELASIAVGLAFLAAPAWWNRFPLLQYDTGGYLARWYEGYLVPSRSTAYGLFLKATEAFDFWPAVLVQSALTLWVLTLLMRALGVGARPWRRIAMVGALSASTALPWMTSILLTDIFAGLGVLAFYLLAVRARDLGRFEKAGLFLLVAFATATHSATMVVLLALLGAGSLASVFVRAVVPPRGLMAGGAAIATGAAMLLTTNFVVSGQLAWTPGGFGITFGRMLQDGIVTRYLHDHCPQAHLKLCPYRNELPATADEFLWSPGIFDHLGRFAGMNDEMRAIVIGSLAAYPWAQLETAARATLAQLRLNATGYGVHDKLWHTYAIVERFLPAKVAAMRAARQQHRQLDFTGINRIHVPVALGSMILTVLILGKLVRRRQFDDLAVLAGTAVVAILTNAFVCGALSGPHDRYGSRIVWIATVVVATALARAMSATRSTPFAEMESMANSRSEPATL